MPALSGAPRGPTAGAAPAPRTADRAGSNVEGWGTSPAFLFEGLDDEASLMLLILVVPTAINAQRWYPRPYGFGGSRSYPPHVIARPPAAVEAPRHPVGVVEAPPAPH